MIRAAVDKPDLACPTCRYDLRGSKIDGEVFRCPECGAMSDFAAILRAYREKRRAQGQMLGAGVIGVLILAALAVGRPYLGPARLGGWDAALLGFGAFFCWVLTVPWIGAPHRIRGSFALGAGVLLVLFVRVDGFVAHGLCAAALAGWYLAFYSWALRRGYY